MTPHWTNARFLLSLTLSLLAVGCGARVRVERGVKVRMRDGVALLTDIYRPSGAGKFPVLLMRTPYCNHTPDRGYYPMVSRGYIVIVQQVRGRCGSEGVWYPFEHEGEDGFDTVEWAAALPYSTGKVGMFGGSYPGAAQLLAAVAAPPHLSAIFPVTTASDFHDGWVYQGGAFQQWLDESWLSQGLADNGPAHRWFDGLPFRGSLLQHVFPEADHVHMDWVVALPLDSYPIRDGAAGPDFAPYFRDWLDHPGNGEYWKRWSVADRYSRITAPAYHVGGWYDAFLDGTIRNYVGIRNQGNGQIARGGQKMLIGPWTHAAVYNRKAGELDFGPTAEIKKPNKVMFRWYDHFLKGVDNGIEREEPIKIFVMGKNQWRDEDEWPPAGAQTVRYYLHSGGHANGLNGDGVLSTNPPGGNEPVDEFVYDPAHPAPTQGGSLCCDEAGLGSGPRDQRAVEGRQDVLVFTSPAFPKDFEVTGPVSVELYAESSAVDTDFTAKLSDVWPNGYSQNLAEGIRRSRYRDSSEKMTLMVPGVTYKFTIDLWATSNVFLSGHRMRLEVSSSNFPRFDRNLNTGEDQGHSSRMMKATNIVVHDGEHPSAVVLSVMAR